MLSSPSTDRNVIVSPVGPGDRTRLLWNCLRHAFPDEYVLELGAAGELIITHRHHAMGVWRESRDGVAYFPVVHGAPVFETKLLSEAIRHTRQLIECARPPA